MDKRTKWSLAAKYGLILSLVTIIVSLIGMFNPPQWLGTAITVMKFVAIFFILNYFMKQYTMMYDGAVTYGTSFKFGFLVCFLSSIVCTTYSYIDYTILRPELMETMIEAMLYAQDSMGNAMMDYQTLSAMMPKVLIFSLFLDYIIFALIYPAIVANYTKKDIFDDFGEESTDIKTEE